MSGVHNLRIRGVEVDTQDTLPIGERRDPWHAYVLLSHSSRQLDFVYHFQPSSRA